MNLFEAVKKATGARLLEWRPTGEEYEEHGRAYRGYETQVDEFRIRTLIVQGKGGWFGYNLAFGLLIEANGSSITFTTDPKLIPGEKPENGFEPMATFITVQGEVEDRDLPNTLRRRLAQLLAS